MAFPQSFLDELVARSDIVDVVGCYVAPDEKGQQSTLAYAPSTTKRRAPSPSRRTSRSTTASAASKGGGVISFIMEEENLSFPDAVRFPGQAGQSWTVPEEESRARRAAACAQRVLALNRDAARVLLQNCCNALSGAGGAPTTWTSGRSRRKTAVSFGLGAALDQLGRA